MGEFEQLASVTYRHARRGMVLLAGSTVLLIGVLMIVLPGPAIVVIPLGLGILAAEFVWAARVLAHLRRAMDGLGRYVMGRLRSRA